MEISCHRVSGGCASGQALVTKEAISFLGNVDPKTGVIVDNIPQRGSAGLEFTMVDRNNLKESYKLLAPDLIVLHYGLNIVKNLSVNYSYYRKGLTRQLALLREIAPSR